MALIVPAPPLFRIESSSVPSSRLILLTSERALAIKAEPCKPGINYFETTDVYGGAQRPDVEKGYGISEEITGRWSVQGGRRDLIVVGDQGVSADGPRRQ